MSFSELQVSEMHIYICKYCFIYAYQRKKSILDKRDIFIQTEKKSPKQLNILPSLIYRQALEKVNLI